MKTQWHREEKKQFLFYILTSSIENGILVITNVLFFSLIDEFSFWERKGECLKVDDQLTAAVLAAGSQEGLL